MKVCGMKMRYTHELNRGSLGDTLLRPLAGTQQKTILVGIYSLDYASGAGGL